MLGLSGGKDSLSLLMLLLGLQVEFSQLVTSTSWQ
jgi:tRNA(Ile)-lysidine synthase TilS/MesJ